MSDIEVNIMNWLKKAQGATEYLVILAVVIIIALVVVGAMGGIPGIGSGAKARASKAYWQAADLAIPAYALSAGSDLLNVTVRNNFPGSVSGLTISVGGTSLTCESTSLAAGASTKCSASKTCASAGDAFSYEVSMTYTDTATGASYPFTGEGHALEGTCAN
ncbi:hypothetical protein COY28_02990 [Candidatus Woesearchaeota archaeon CG_4_10_14_0_2_um_filter_57_5]|nr:MAG: hypothetical protein AUJ68_06720 [Candidatus Woesearchaeota archaeon CG1_02_57_44]PIN68359.1 MAG: hypothetical protein COV94_05070 [Candidatus Woesearchaeota archaeon CG11_big_fil_rev_8_21_14_0_20_57_5]PIZ54058.1 MAG: hypothetical protein COY28_02990 [Candidatus Woesearchaeota archaeon CG_4_10_14_0_2_um_filter_57_5]